MRWVDDYLVLGKAAPDKSKEYGHTVCSAGYSQKLEQFVRVYPTWIDMNKKLQRWNIVRLPLEQTSRDYRYESWTITGRQIREAMISTIETISRFGC